MQMKIFLPLSEKFALKSFKRNLNKQLYKTGISDLRFVHLRAAPIDGCGPRVPKQQRPRGSQPSIGAALIFGPSGPQPSIGAALR